MEAYLYPTVDENREKFSWGRPEVESIREYAKKTFGWTNKRTDEIVLPIMKRLDEKTTQKTIQNYFKITGVTSRTDLKVSKRVRTALEQMSADPDAPMPVNDVVEQKKPKKKITKKTTAKVDEDNKDECLLTEQDSSVKMMKLVKPKQRRKRKPNTDTVSDPESKDQQNGNNLSSTSATVTGVSVGVKKIVLPDNNVPIPQREMDKQIMKSNRLKAIEVLKKMKASKM